MEEVIQVVQLQMLKKKIIDNMRVIKILGIFLLFCCKSLAQNIDTSKLLLNSKMMLVNYLDQNEDLDYYEAYLHYTPQVIFINSTGFDSSYIFYKIRIKDTVILKQKIDANKTLLRTFFQFKDEYITFAFDRTGEVIYKLNGEKCNDLDRFIDRIIAYQNVVLSHEIFYGEKLSRKNIHKYFSIEGFNLEQSKVNGRKKHSSSK